jgi:hypothetical protein
VPVSKKPPRKATPRSSRKAAVADGTLPDRRTMESYLAAIAGQGRDDAIAKAQDIMYDAWDCAASRSRITLARKALAISPLCADACNLLAEAAGPSRKPAISTPAASRLGSWRSGLRGLRNMLGISGAS